MPSRAQILQLGYYWEAKVLLTSVKLDLFTLLAQAGAREHPAGLTAKEIAGRLSVSGDERALTRLLDALVAIELLRQANGRYTNHPEAETLLSTTSPQYAGDLLILQDDEWDQWGQLEATVRTGTRPVTGNVFQTNPEMARHVSMVLHRIGLQTAPLLATRLNLKEARTLLDLGGGAGTYAIAFCQASPRLRATIADLPATLHTAERVVAEAKMTDRIALRPGNFHTDDLGGPYDVVFMSDVIHYQESDENQALLRRAAGVLVPGGRLVLKDKFLDEGRASPAWTAIFAVHLLVHTEHGDCYTVAEAMDWMKAAGLTRIEELERTTLLQGLSRG